MRKGLFMMGCLFVGISLCGCIKGQGQDKTEDGSRLNVSKELFAMDTYMSFSAYGIEAKEAVDAAITEVKRLDALLSTGSRDSEVSKINNVGGGVLSEDTGALLEKSLELYWATDGVFDVTIYPVMEIWGFAGGGFRVPREGELERVRKLVDASKILYDVVTKRMSFGQEDMKIDFGGIAKGYTSVRIIKIFEEYGIESGMVNLGGNVQVLGLKNDGSRWKVAIQSPEDNGNYLGVLEVENQAVITSGGYERYFEENGVVYHHIIDPSTGYPADSGLSSVTIVSSDGMLADGLSTSLFIMGLEEAKEYCQKHEGEFDAIFMTTDQKIYITHGIEEQFESEYEVCMIK